MERLNPILRAILFAACSLVFLIARAKEGKPHFFDSGAAFTPAPSNDEPSTALELPIGSVCYTLHGSLIGATSSGIAAGSCAGTPDDDVWYRFVATKSNPTISLSNLSNFSAPQLQLFSGTSVPVTSLACGTTSITASGLTIGANYFIRVYSNGNTAVSARFEICATNPGAVLVTDSTTMLFNIDTVGKRLGFPWEIQYGPDDSLWITEARGYRVVRISASRSMAMKDVAPQQVLKIPLNAGEVNFGRNASRWPQGGMQGLAIHPEFMSDPDKRFVYIGYVFKQVSCPGGSNVSNPSGFPCVYRAKIIRCRFYFAGDAGNPTALPKRDTLVISDTLLSNIPGSNDHNSGRLKIGPVPEGPDNTYKLYYTIGDMGAGQFNNSSRAMQVQNRDTLEGKIIRLNTEPDTDGNPASPIHDFDRWRIWIPNDNPYAHSVNGLRTPVYSYGHRNAQGIVWGNVGGSWRLYSSEQGDKSDDEINIIGAGKNYGWPKVVGFDDDNYSTEDNATDGFTANDMLAGSTVVSERSWSIANAATYVNPIFSFFPWTGAQLQGLTGDIFTWPTVAASGLDIYPVARAGWHNSLLVTSLKYGMFRLPLNSAGTAIDPAATLNATDTIPLLHGWRVRDITIAPDGNTIWAVVDSSGSTSGPTGGFDGTEMNTKDGGKVLRLTFKSLIILPARFISFTGKLLPSNEIDLQWIAMVDGAHSHFVVERMASNGMFEAIGRVSGGAPYGFIDERPIVGTNFYRIRQVDTDGKWTYSAIINVMYRPMVLQLRVYPNPAREQIQLQLFSTVGSASHVRILDASGRLVQEAAIGILPGSQIVNLRIASLANGIYLMQVISQKGEVMGQCNFLKE